MSGYGSPSDEEKNLVVGYRHHLMKPFVPQEIALLLQKASEAIRLP